MFIAMNRFRVKKGEEENFETVWKQRDSFLNEVPGFKEFQLLRGPAADDHTLYASHAVWASVELDRQAGRCRVRKRSARPTPAPAPNAICTWVRPTSKASRLSCPSAHGSENYGQLWGRST